MSVVENNEQENYSEEIETLEKKIKLQERSLKSLESRMKRLEQAMEEDFETKKEEKQTGDSPSASESSSSERYWKIYSNEFTLSKKTDTYSLDAPGERYKICTADEENPHCTSLVQYDGDIKGYLVENMQYITEASNAEVTEEALTDVREKFPIVTRTIPTERKTWTQGDIYYDTSIYFVEEGSRTLVIRDGVADFELSGEHMEVLLDAIDF